MNAALTTPALGVHRQVGFPDLRPCFKLALRLTQARRGSLLVRTATGLVIQVAHRMSGLVIAGTIIPIGGGIAGWVAQHCRPLLIEREGHLPPGLKLRGHGYRTGAFMSVPIRLGHAAVGVINVADHAEGKPFTRHELDMLSLIARHAATLIRLHRSISETLPLAEVDYLTGLGNRRSLDRRLREEIERIKRYGTILSVLMIDLDGFKAINDRCGHGTGDAILRLTSVTLQNATRAADAAFRYGGDEFLVLLPNTDSERAAQPARRFLEQLQSARLPPPLSGRIDALAASMGICTGPQHAETGAGLVSRADQALRLAKALGSRIEIWQPSVPRVGIDDAPPSGSEILQRSHAAAH